ncbi:branched-chain amino acid ABC transporter permease [Alphaproteobacteria bacterium HT1-32]|nr:branched-chain amino acid ABC transporter permease [Alphaproteobacteria bacterium HT1-32]
MNPEFLAGVRTALPVSVGALVFGLTLGVTASQAGLSAVEMGLMSATVFAGASQLVAVQMFDQGATLIAIATAVFAVNARHMLMGATLTPLIRSHPRPLRWLALLMMVDESWALTMARSRQVPTGPAFIIGAGCLFFPIWLSATMAGVWFGDLVPDPRLFGLDFLGVAVFIGMLALLQPKRRDLPPFIATAVLSPLLATVLPGSWSIIAAASAGALIAAVRP